MFSACSTAGIGTPGYWLRATEGVEAAVARAVLPIRLPQSELLLPWAGPYGGVPPWDRITPDCLSSAMREAIAQRSSGYIAIAENAESPNFANTFVAMQMADEPFERVKSLFWVMVGNIGTSEYQAVAREVSPLMAIADDEITFNERLFARVKAVINGAATAGLNAEQTRISERGRNFFIRNGAALNAAAKDELRRINSALANAFTTFSQKIVNDEKSWSLIANEAGVAGLPASAKAAAASAARSRNLQGWAIVNTRSSVDPFLTFSDDRAQREAVWRKFVNRGDNADANDTKATIAEIVSLRQQRARLLGFGNHAEWRMQDTMAKTPVAAMMLMNRVWGPAKARVAEEVADMRALAGDVIEPWDYLYYADKVRKSKYDLDQNELNQYLELEAVKRGAFYMAEHLYGFVFTPLPNGSVPVFHPDVKVFEVKDKASGRHIGLFYSDDFARAGKQSGAWAAPYRGQSTYDGRKNALVSNSNNFTKADAGQPLLISLDDAKTLFHEFGHALHFFSWSITYPALRWTPNDYTEYPAHVHENWVLSRPILDGFMKHNKTGQPMPQELVGKILAASTFNQGYDTVSYLSAALVDMDLHTQDLPPIDIAAFERDCLARHGMPREIVMRHRLPQFNHLFSSDDYSAGYYAYLWSQVMDADTWAYFQESGDVFNPDIASRYKSIILAEGNNTDRAEAYRRFRGRDPDVGALLRIRGFNMKK